MSWFLLKLTLDLIQLEIFHDFETDKLEFPMEIPIYITRGEGIDRYFVGEINYCEQSYESRSRQLFQQTMTRLEEL